MAVTSPPARRTPTALRIVAVPLVAAVLVGGAILVVGQLLPGDVWVEVRAERRLVRRAPARSCGASPRGPRPTSCGPFSSP